ncbi:hypothetical protein LEP1GSC016_2122 [Leptospira borgpetersenii serovar Hardjo-bovis str. Sponselee]|uniref:Uncharacterized protein n=1 Tax=Leptospira borgpetersenii serovar Hardjo-bovis str. Sponselee TaxID=1303729 RepID=M6C4R4_LEPBO|nr:hypothetical protein LEP1GSC016_2122 [Leptospira borgpetersenii serovar Hardjo-bovis str. Sponselee]
MNTTKKYKKDTSLETNLSITFGTFRQNGAPSGLEKRGLYASIYHKTRKPTEGTQ